MNAMNKFFPSLILLFALSLANNSIAQIDKTIFKNNTIPVLDSNRQLSISFREMLKKELKQVEIVSIGEATHGDGASFQHKIALVKFLHEEMNFNVLAFEFGFYGNWLTYKKLKAGFPTSEATKFSGWSHSKWSYPIYEYMAESYQNGNPLIYAGFDGEKVPDGVPNIQQFLKKIQEDLQFNFTENDSTLVDSLIRAVHGRLGNPYKKNLAYKRVKHAKTLIQNLLDQWLNKKQLLTSKLTDEEYLISELTLQSILMEVKTTFIGNFWNITRDKQMGDRIVWLKEKLYPGEKIILWGASSHFAKNMIQLERKNLAEIDHTPYYQAGDWINLKYGEKFYSIAFTTASGNRGTVYPSNHHFKKYESIREVEPPIEGSFEEMAFNTGHETLFCNLRAANKQLNKPFIAYPFGHNMDYGLWPKVVDGIYFIREMKADIYQ